MIDQPEPNETSGASRLVYAPPTTTPRSEFDAVMNTGSPAERAQAFLGYVHTEEDWNVTEDACFAYLDDPDPNIRRLAVLFLGYIPRLHGTVHVWRVVPALGRIGRTALRDDDSTMSYTVEDALGDIAVYMGLNVGRRPYAVLPWSLALIVERGASTLARHAFGWLTSTAPHLFDADVASAVDILLRAGQAREARSGYAVATAWCVHSGVRLTRWQATVMGAASLLIGFPQQPWRDLLTARPNT